MRPEVAPWLLHQGRCLSCGPRCQAPLPAEQVSGYGPRLTGCIGERAGIVGASRSAGQDLCASGCGIPRSTGAIQKLGARVSAALVPQYDTRRPVARTAPVNSMDEPSWLVPGDRHWLWVMANSEGAYFQRPPPLHGGIWPAHCRLAGPPGERWVSGLSGLAGTPAALLGPSAPHGQGPG
jgi:hypothetical protein